MAIHERYEEVTGSGCGKSEQNLKRFWSRLTFDAQMKQSTKSVEQKSMVPNNFFYYKKTEDYENN